MTKDRAGWMPDNDEWNGTWYDVDDQLLPYPDARAYLEDICGFSEDEAEEYLALVKDEDFVSILI